MWSKIFERFRTTSAAFRFFDYHAKGKFKKADFMLGCEKLRLRFSASDLDQVWNYFDINKRGFVTFNDFSLLDSTNNRLPRMIDFETIASERKAERDRIAKDLIDSISRSSEQPAFGVVTLPSENMG